MLPFVERELPFCDKCQPTFAKLNKKQDATVKSSSMVYWKHKDRAKTRSVVENICKREEQYRLLLMKDMKTAARIKEQHAKAAGRMAVEATLRNLRHSQARARRYAKEFEDDIKRQLQQLNTAEEKVFRNAVEHVCDVVSADTRAIDKKLSDQKAKELDSLYKSAAELQDIHRSLQNAPLAPKHPKTSIPVISESHRQLLQDVRERKGLLEGYLRNSDDRSHHRQLHKDLLHYKIPKSTTK